MLPSFQAPSRQEGIKWTTTRYHHPSTVFNGVYPANVAGVLLITPPDYAKAETRQHESDPDEAKPSTRTTGFALYDEGPQDEICCDSTD
jgi:hypothetical protein